MRLDDHDDDDLGLPPMTARERVLVALAALITVGWATLLLKGWWWSW